GVRNACLRQGRIYLVFGELVLRSHDVREPGDGTFRAHRAPLPDLNHQEGADAVEFFSGRPIHRGHFRLHLLPDVVVQEDFTGHRFALHMPVVQPHPMGSRPDLLLLELLLKMPEPTNQLLPLNGRLTSDADVADDNPTRSAPNDPFLLRTLLI